MVFVPTAEFRFVRVVLFAKDYRKPHGERGLNQAGSKHILQQRWVCVEANEDEWRDIPVIEECEAYGRRRMRGTSTQQAEQAEREAVAKEGEK